MLKVSQLHKLIEQKKTNSSGVTMIELLVVVAIIATFFILVALLMTAQIARTRDAQRKADLEKIKVAFEDYYNDTGCYPTQDDYYSWRCDSEDFKPYLNDFPCDPMTKSHYTYVPDFWGCRGYAILTTLDQTSDPSIQRVGCEPTGCDDFTENYGIAVGLPLASFTGPGSMPPANACFGGFCNFYADPAAAGCTQISQEPDCGGGCLEGATWCEY
jgi:Tfp pilus assembly protein PilE